MPARVAHLAMTSVARALEDDIRDFMFELDGC